MAAPDLTHVTTALGSAKSAVQEAKAKVPAEAAPHLEEVEAQLAEAQNRVNEAQATAEENRGGAGV